MRPLTAFGFVVALCAACGGSTPPVANTGTGQPPPPPGMHRLSVTVEGQGRVVSSPAGIDCSSGTCDGVFADGASVSLQATAAPGSKFAGWGVGCSGPGSCSVTLRADMQVFAHFDPDVVPPPPPPPPVQITLSAAISGPGQVTGGGLTCGNGANACSVTMAPGIPVTLTATAAPAARFMSWGGACSGSDRTCQLTPKADTSVTATFEFELQTLAANDGTIQFHLALNSTSVFYGRFMPDGPSIWSVPKAGGTPTRIASGVGNFIVADDAFVYWTDGFGIYSAPVTGGTGSLLATGHVGHLALDEVGALYWVFTADSTHTGEVHRMQNRVDAVIASGQFETGGVAVDSTHAYFTCARPNTTDRSIRRVPKTGGTVETVIATSLEPLVVRLDPQNVYWRDSSTTVWMMSRSGGSPRALTGKLGSNGFANLDLDVNAGIVWFMWVDSSQAPKGLFRAEAANGGLAQGVDTSSDLSWFGPRVDDTAVYYIHGGALLKRLK